MRSGYFICLLFTIVAIPLLSSCGSARKATSGATTSSVSRPKRPDSGGIPMPSTLDSHTRSLLEEARGWLGVKYAYGGHSKSGTDCSGMVMELFGSAAGIKLPRNSREQHKFCKKVDKKELVPGDLVFFANNLRTGRIGHVGLYVGDGLMVHASTSRGVIVSGLGEDYWTKHYVAGGRVEDFYKRVSDQQRKDKKRKTKSGKAEKPAPQTERETPTPVVPVPATVPMPADADESADTADVTVSQWFDILP